MQSSGGVPPGGLDDAIAAHGAARGHWPGKTVDESKQLIGEVRDGWNNRYAATTGETISHKGDVILIESPARSEGIIFQPGASALEYFRRWVRRNPGGT